MNSSGQAVAGLDVHENSKNIYGVEELECIRSGKGHFLLAALRLSLFYCKRLWIHTLRIRAASGWMIDIELVLCNRLDQMTDSTTLYSGHLPFISGQLSKRESISHLSHKGVPLSVCVHVAFP